HRREQLCGGARLRLVDLGDGEADVDQDPVARLDRLVALEEADVDGAPDSGNINLGEPERLVDDLHDASWDGQAHLRVDLLHRFPRKARTPGLPHATYLPDRGGATSWRIGRTCLLACVHPATGTARRGPGRRRQRPRRPTDTKRHRGLRVAP